MEDLGFFPYPSSFSTGFDDEILDPGPTSFFLKDPTGEDVLLAQGLDQLNSKLGLFEESNHSPINVDDDWLMKDLSEVNGHTLDIPYTLDELQADHGYFVENGILQDPNDLIEPIYPPKKIPKYEDDGYKCLVCNIALFRLKEVINHVLTVHCSKGEYLCTLCNTELLTCGAVKKHIKNVHFGFKPFQCPACKKSIQQKSHLKIHIDKQHGGKKGLLKKALNQHLNKASKVSSSSASAKNDNIQCHLCHKNFLSEETKEKHLSTFHKVNHVVEQNQPKITSFFAFGEASLECPVCHIALDSLDAKKDHVKNVHHNLRTFECSKCPSMFHSQLHLKAHKMVNHGVSGNLSNRIICDYHNCKMPMKSLKNLLSHVEDYHAYQCPECPRHLQTTSGLAKHYKKAHISNELLCCTYCGNCYKDEKELSHHVKEKHLNDSTATESSDIESQTMNDSKSLLVEKIMHPDVLLSIKKSVAKLAREHRGRIPCEYCRANETFKTEEDVLEHVKNMHPIQCPDCPLKMFKYPTSVRKHFKKFHGSETPYFCKTCTLVFKSADAVQLHMENEHGIANVVVVNSMTPTSLPPIKNELKIKCIVCGLKFETSQALAEHRSENHFYKCGDCDKEYKLTDSLRKHVKVTHNENVTMTCCKYCDKVILNPSQKNEHLINFHPDIAPPSLNDSIVQEAAKPTTQIEVLQPIKTNGIMGGYQNEEKIASFKCPKCPKTYNIGKSLRKHCRKNHNKLSICFCHHCPKVVFYHLCLSPIIPILFCL